MATTSASRRLADKHELLKGAAGEPGWLGRRRPWQGALWPPASRRCRPDGGVVELQGRLCGEGRGRGVDWERGRARPSAGRRQRDAVTRVHARAKRALWARPEHARYVLGNMPRHARVLEQGWQIKGLG